LSLFGRDWPLFDSGQPDLRMPGWKGDDWHVLEILRT
jgi:hypothetical protein